jgi:hypothetical protein
MSALHLRSARPDGRPGAVGGKVFRRLALDILFSHQCQCKRASTERRRLHQFVQSKRNRLQYLKQVSYGSVVLAEPRYRTNKVKRMHSIIEGLLPVLEAMAEHPAIAQINPGRISANRRAGDRNITVQYFTTSGLKLLARSPSSIQEVFVVTSEPETVKSWLLQRGLTQEMGSKPAVPKPAVDIQETPLRAARTRRDRPRRRKPRQQPATPSPERLTDTNATATVSDHLSPDILDKLRQLPRSNGSINSSPKRNGAIRPKVSAPRKSKCQAMPENNPLEAWLDQVSDDDIRRLARKLKGNDP